MMQASLQQDSERTTDCYRTGGIVYRRAGQADNAALKSILAVNAMDSWVNLSTEHEPDYFAAARLFGESTAIIAQSETSVAENIGMCSWSFMPCHVNGEAIEAGYLGELRVMPAFRNRFSIIRNGFRSVQVLSGGASATPVWFTSIAKQNEVARRLLESGLQDLPCYRPRGEMHTLALSSRLGKTHGRLQPAQRADIPALVDFYNRRAQHYQYAPVLTQSWLQGLDGSNGLQLSDFYLLREHGEIRACFALWDQRRFKQSVVRGYRFPLNIVRAPYNVFAGLGRRVRLPAVGEQIDYVFIAFVCIDEQVTDGADEIISGALHCIRQRGAEMGMLGLSARNPLWEKLQHVPHETYHTCIDSVVWPGQETMRLDKRPVQPEIAVL